MDSVVGTLERVGRLILWLALAGICIAIPLGMHTRDKETAALLVEEKAAAAAKQKKADALAADEARKPERLLLSSVGGLMRAMNRDVGSIWFTNASPRAGVVCADGVATGPTGQSTRSLTSCQLIEAYASNVKINLMFAGADLERVCPKNDCELSVKDTPVGESIKVAAAK